MSNHSDTNSEHSEKPDLFTELINNAQHTRSDEFDVQNATLTYKVPYHYGEIPLHATKLYVDKSDFSKTNLEEVEFATFHASRPEQLSIHKITKDVQGYINPIGLRHRDHDDLHHGENFNNYVLQIPESKIHDAKGEVLILFKFME